MTSYIQTTQFHQEKLNLQVLSLVLPISKREEANDSLERSETESNGGAWSSLYSLSGTKESTHEVNDGLPPPPPTSISKKSKYGTKNNLDTCTETLGCENGTMYTIDEYKRDGLLSERLGFLEEAEETRRERKEMVERRIKRVKTGTEFPPALTTRTSENFLNVVRERENGRMKMYTWRRQSTVTAERRDGRLVLRLPSISGEEMKEIQEERERNTGEEDEGEEGDYLGVVGKEMNGDDEMEGRKYVLAGRCKEGEKRKKNWESCRVASAI